MSCTPPIRFDAMRCCSHHSRQQTCLHNSALAVNPITGDVAYPAGSVVVIYQPRRNRQFRCKKQRRSRCSYSCIHQLAVCCRTSAPTSSPNPLPETQFLRLRVTASLLFAAFSTPAWARAPSPPSLGTTQVLPRQQGRKLLGVFQGWGHAGGRGAGTPAVGHRLEPRHRYGREGAGRGAPVRDWLHSLHAQRGRRRDHGF